MFGFPRIKRKSKHHTPIPRIAKVSAEEQALVRRRAAGPPASDTLGAGVRRSNPLPPTSNTVGAGVRPDASIRRQTGDVERVRQPAAELNFLRRELSKAEQRAEQAEEKLRKSESALGRAQQRARIAEAKLVDIEARLKTDELLRTLGKAELERVEAAQNALAAAECWRQSFDRQHARIEGLVCRTGQLTAVRERPDLVDELSTLHGEDLWTCVQVVGVVLRDALGPAATDEVVPLDDTVNADPELLERALRSLETIVERCALQAEQEVVVAPGADGTIVAELGPEQVSMVDVRDSVGVVRGDDSDVIVIHVCDVDRPVVEIAELLEMSPNGSTFSWFSSAIDPGHVTASTTFVSSNALSAAFWANIWNSNGVAVGDNITMQITRHHRVEGCRVNLRELLRDDEVRDDLAACRGDSDEAEAARERLPETVAQAIGRADMSNLVPVSDVARRASAGRRPAVRQRGPRLIVTHGAGVAVGRNPGVSAETRTEVGQVRVE